MWDTGKELTLSFAKSQVGKKVFCVGILLHGIKGEGKSHSVVQSGEN